ncbi:MAG: alpha/beta fold hydrolase [Planctomyces sp.]|nr:alpha/beta fold hydrolase [Planctomyces sp.]
MERIAELFAQVVELKDPEARAAFLQRKLGQQSPELAEIQELLRVHEAATDFLETPSILLLDDLKDEVPGLIGSPISGLDEKLGTRIGRYTIHRRLGSGGMGTVYLGHDEELQRPVAIKFVSAHYASDANSKWLQRFEREAHSAATLNHPNILTVHEILRSEGVPCLVTEYVEGRTLRDLLLSGPLSLKLALSITRQLLRALAAAHERRVIHRDLKPENVMVRPDQLVKVLDFGIARQLQLEGNDSADEKNANALTNPGQIQGTLWYMSPEQLRGGPVDARSDLFSLGCVIYEMLAGRPPFARSTGADSIAAVLHELPPDLRAEFPEVPVNLSQIVRRLLAGNPADRYQSAQEVLQDVSRHFDDKEDDSTTNVAGDKPAVVPGHTGNAQPASTDLQIPEVHYATSDEVSIAYQVIGSGPLDLIFVMGWVSHLDWFWKEPSFARFLRRLGDSFRVILFDKRGTGLSDRVPNDQLPTLEQRMDDVRAVMEAAGSDRAVLCGVSEGGPLCSLFAATYPDRTAALIMIGAYARRLRDDDYPWGPTEVEHGQFLEQIRRGWGGPVGIETRAPSRSSDPLFRRWWCDYLRMGASPGAAVALTRMNARVDVRPVLGAIRVPTLVIHRTGDMCLRVDEGRYLASRISDARFVELSGADHLPFVGNQEEVLSAIEEFQQRMRSAVSVDRILATVLAVRSADGAMGSTEAEASLRRQIAEEFSSFRCTRTQQNGNSMLATFDGPVRAIRAALRIRDLVQRAGHSVQIGLTVGECWLRPDRVTGSAIDGASLIAEMAAPGIILASSTLRDLVPGSNIRFAPPSDLHQSMPAGTPLVMEVLG